ncbi:MAG: DUF305 domain-containing protein [Gemmatimonadota bacterium]|nr:DUF305 domain-containing protein [Gemmatimonadota bacterium]
MALTAALLVGMAACGTKEVAKTDSASGIAPASMAMAHDSAARMKTADANTGNMAMGNMAMTGDADHDFLRMMTDHHKGLIRMAHETIESKDKLGVKPIAVKLDKEQDAEMDQMSTMLEKTFKDPYAPKVTPENQTMADELKGKTGAGYDRTFLQNVISHHEQSIKMIDAYLPNAKNPELKAMAEKMKAAQSQQIAELKKQVTMMPSK